MIPADREPWHVSSPLINGLAAIRNRDGTTAEPSPKLIAAIDQIVEQQGIGSKEPGVAILIVQPGEPTIERGYGLANLKTGKPITPRTVFELASVSKTFTSTAVLILHDRKKLSVDDDVRKLLPELPVYNAQHPIRIRDLLHHTSGLPDYMDFENVPMKHKTYQVNDDFVGLFAARQKKFPLSFPTGQKYEYNNTNYMLLGTIVARASGLSFGKFLHDELFQPAGMTHSFVYESPEAVPKDHAPDAVGYVWRKKKQEWDAGWGLPPGRHEIPLTVGDGAVWTNLEDMARWDAAIREKKFLQPETWKLALTESKTGDGKINDYGCGWQIYREADNMYGYGHEGSWGGFITSYYRYLTADRTTVLLSNRGNLDTDKLWTALDKACERH